MLHVVLGCHEHMLRLQSCKQSQTLCMPARLAATWAAKCPIGAGLSKSKIVAIPARTLKHSTKA